MSVASPIYLDYNATTPVDDRVLDAMLPYFSRRFGNSASRTHAYGWEADEAVKLARKSVAGLLGCEPGELVFTSGATEAINLGIKGAAAAYQSKGRHFITCTTEHRAVLDVFEHLERDGAEVTRLPVQPDGRLDPELLRSVLRNDTVLVAIMLANNESGVLQPIRELAELTHERGALFFCDTTQAIGKLQVAVNELGIDLCTVSAHKLPFAKVEFFSVVIKGGCRNGATPCRIKAVDPGIGVGVIQVPNLGSYFSFDDKGFRKRTDPRVKIQID